MISLAYIWFFAVYLLCAKSRYSNDFPKSKVPAKTFFFINNIKDIRGKGIFFFFIKKKYKGKGTLRLDSIFQNGLGNPDTSNYFGDVVVVEAKPFQTSLPWKQNLMIKSPALRIRLDPFNFSLPDPDTVPGTKNKLAKILENSHTNVLKSHGYHIC